MSPFFSRVLTKRTSLVVPAIGILSCGNDRVHCQKGHDTSKDDNKDVWFQGQCLKRQLYKPKLPYPLWDYNWDGRMLSDSTLSAQSKGVRVKGKTRHVILIRHGQYDETHEDDDKRQLTKLGRAQAELTGKRLAVMAKGIGEQFGPCNITVVRSSGMERAKETADIIAKYLPGVKRAKPDPMLNEALPAPIIPMRAEIDATDEIDKHANRIEAAFQKYIYRATPPTRFLLRTQEDSHEFEVIVCHGNVIRYMFCRALQLPPEAWLRMSIFNCSLTYLMIKPNGYVSCRMLGDIGHLGMKHSTFSGSHGFAWS